MSSDSATALHPTPQQSPPDQPSPSFAARDGDGNEAASLRLPRILCLHGGGTNAAIFRIQCRVLQKRLAPHFRFVFADAPISSPPGPGVEPVFSELGPFRSWLPKLGQTDPPDREGVRKIDESVAAAVRADDARGATGSVVALLGFSQGAKVAASLLLREQQTLADSNNGDDGGGATKLIRGYRFAVLLAGRGPLFVVGRDLEPHNLGEEGPRLQLQLPTIHVHGLRDSRLEMHRHLLRESCQPGTTRLVEWDGDHRVPIKSHDVSAVVTQVIQVATSLNLMS
ncbi:serine hydrolase FSH [Chaetomium strumarium]|uniref:Serine hydrolase FSH n=1 Tax=Chaetomium strumarium TaxID=1170767 RepID=A0AAJ0M6U6_9PEZI|nr:serine hydrolase FSH [Chaetomium strumarium]